MTALDFSCPSSVLLTTLNLHLTNHLSPRHLRDCVNKNGPARVGYCVLDGTTTTITTIIIIIINVNMMELYYRIGIKSNYPPDRSIDRSTESRDTVMTAVSRRLEPLRVMRKAATTAAPDGGASTTSRQQHYTASVVTAAATCSKPTVVAADNSLSASNSSTMR